VSNDLDLTLEFFRDRRPERALYEYGVRHADAVVVQSRRQVELADRTFPTVTRVLEIPSFAATPELSSAPPEAFLWAGRLDRYKQPERYIELAEAMPDAHFWMIARRSEPERGSGSPGANDESTFEEEVRARAQRVPNLEVLEARPHADAMKLLERSVAIVNTGKAEGMPNLFLEAWSRGIPVLSYEFDPDSRIERGGLGEVAHGSSAHFVQGARRLWEGRNDRLSLSRRLRAHVMSHHSAEAVTSRWETLVAELRAA
jgi:glycosyltransferase involved in cell wall biosynthesis